MKLHLFTNDYLRQSNLIELFHQSFDCRPETQSSSATSRYTAKEATSAWKRERPCLCRCATNRPTHDQNASISRAGRYSARNQPDGIVERRALKIEEEWRRETSLRRAPALHADPNAPEAQSSQGSQMRVSLIEERAVQALIHLDVFIEGGSSLFAVFVDDSNLRREPDAGDNLFG